MAQWQHYYLIRIEFLGFRYHGWQKQPQHKSVHGQIDKTCSFILGHEDYRTLGCGRTDAKVSAHDYAFELFVNENLNTDKLLHQLNKNLPTDIRAKSVMEVNQQFNVMQDVAEKEYHYYFSFGDKSHPFNAPFIQDMGKKLDIPTMQLGAAAFVGTHNFKRYVSKPSENTQFERYIQSAQIVPNQDFVAGFAPDNAFIFKVRGPGFMRYQVRLMMGALIDLGRNLWTLDDLKNSLIDVDHPPMRHVAPSSGLVLHQVVYKHEL